MLQIMQKACTISLKLLKICVSEAMRPQFLAQHPPQTMCMLNFSCRDNSALSTVIIYCNLALHLHVCMYVHSNSNPLCKMAASDCLAYTFVSSFFIGTFALLECGQFTDAIFQ